MPGRYNPVDIELALREASPPPPFPPGSDRAAWNEAREALGEEKVAALISDAEADARTEVPSLPATLYLEFLREGRREGYEGPARHRRRMLRNLALAECFEGGGRFLDPLLDVAWAICEESSWAWPAHQRDLTDMEQPVIDLSVAMTALQLAELDLLLGDRLDPALGRRIRHETDRRCFTPYLERHDYWWMYNTRRRTVNNWTAVCTGGVAGAALYLEPDPARLARVLDQAARSMSDYLTTFDRDGGSTEGPGYWSYGFGYYVVLAHLVEHRTGGQLSFLEGDHVKNIAQFPPRTQLSPGLYANFSDCDPDISFTPALLAYLSRRLGLPDLMLLAREQPEDVERERELTWGLRNVFWRPEPGNQSFVPAGHDYFGEMAWMISRRDPADPNALVLAAKGGHNGEMHNQNDVGNVIVHVAGESIVADVGRGRYTKAYFGPRRYEHFVNSSLGHSVPVPNGHAQLPGKEHGAGILEHRSDASTDSLKLKMKNAYPEEAGLDSLVRTVTLHRDEGTVELVDEAHFSSGSGSLESVLTTFGKVEVGSSSVLLRGEQGTLRVSFEPESVEARVETERDVDLSSGPADVRRVVFQAGSGDCVRLLIEAVR
jgi:hypothetical protein